MSTILECDNDVSLDLRTAFDRLYHNLRKLAQAILRDQANNISLGATELTHEVYRRMALWRSQPQWDNAGKFFADAARDMERALVDHARRKRTLKRGRNLSRRAFDDLPTDPSENTSSWEQIIQFHERIERLDREHPDLALITTLKFLAGLTNEDIAAVLKCSVHRVQRLWLAAKVYLAKYADQDGDPSVHSRR